MKSLITTLVRNKQRHSYTTLQVKIYPTLNNKYHFITVGVNTKAQVTISFTPNHTCNIARFKLKLGWHLVTYSAEVQEKAVTFQMMHVEKVVWLQLLWISLESLLMSYLEHCVIKACEMSHSYLCLLYTSRCV